MSTLSRAASTSRTDAAALGAQKGISMKSLEQTPGLGKDRSQYLTEDKFNEIASSVTEFSRSVLRKKKTKYT